MIKRLIATVDLNLKMSEGESREDAVFRLWELMQSITGQGLAELTFDIVHADAADED